MKQLLLFLLLPCFVFSQEVQPVLSKDYLALINIDTVRREHIPPDSTNDPALSALQLSTYYHGFAVQNIKIRNSKVFLLPVVNKTITLAGSFNNTIEIKKVNRVPALQTGYVQGRSQNSALQWQGPETNERFSYGPAASSLEYDGGSYAYDINGKLVPLRTGNGKPANVYQNSIFRTGSFLSQSLHLQSKYIVSGKQVLAADLKLGQSKEGLYIKKAQNTANNMSASMESLVKWLAVSGSYSRLQDCFGFGNGDGYLNRVYQNALLTPISFDNTQGARLGAAQRSYNNLADNPFFLLSNESNSFLQTQEIGSFSLEKRQGHFRFRLTQSLDHLRQKSDKGYETGTAFFANGAFTSRNETDRNYELKGNASLSIPFDNQYMDIKLISNYIFKNNGTTVAYTPGAAYDYQRSSNDVSFSSVMNYRKGNTDLGVTLSNKAYFSNTASFSGFFLPAVSGYLKLYNLFDLNQFSVKLAGNYDNFLTELPVNTSFLQNNLLEYSTEQAFRYFPITEVSGFDGLAPIRHQEWTTRLELSYRNRYSFGAEYFHRKISDDVFPVLLNGELKLANLADHINSGVELQAEANTYSRNWRTTHNISFFSNQSKVTEVTTGYDYTPISGFSNVHKVLVKGEALGVLVGNRFLRDAANNMIIGNDGFPLVDPDPGVIGNPLPKFTVKWSNSIGWKSLSLNLDCEWRKGGDVWNGTQAALDYYGRSKTSGALRNVTNYVFAGVLQDGHPNNIPVSFYDPSLPFERNRWVRYGVTGVAEEYIQKGDYIRVNNLGLSYKINSRKIVRSYTFTVYANNLLLWTAYKGADTNKLLYDQANTNGLDFFNLPSVKTIGCNLSLQF